MLKINNYDFEVKFSEVNFRQRNYNEKSYITVNITSEFYPTVINDNIVYGSIDIKIDLESIQSIDALLSNRYEGSIGKISISVNNDGVWESNSIENFTVLFTRREKNNLVFEIEGKDFLYHDSSRIISLYTTSTKEDDLKKKFDMKDFHKKAIRREIGNSIILRYFMK